MIEDKLMVKMRKMRKEKYLNKKIKRRRIEGFRIRK